jgi:hypothetical protein
MPVGMAAAAAVVLVLVGSAVLPGLVGRGPQATDQTAVGPSVVPGPTAITVDTAAILAARVRADGSIDVFSTEVDKVCPTSRLECVPAPSQHQGSTLDLQGAKASTVTLSPNNDRLVFESASGPSSEGKIYVVPVGTAGQPSQQPATPPAGEPAASGKPNASKGPDASGNGNNGQGNGGQAQAIVGHASSFLFDPTTHARTDLGQPDVWMPVVDAHSRFVTYWAGTLRSTDGVEWQLGDGQVVLDGWNAGTSTTPGASAEAPTATDASASPEPAIGPAGHPTPVVTSHVEDFRAKFDPEGIRLAVWVSERVGETDGRLHLLVIDPATGALRPGEPLSGVPALRRFSIDENRLAWVSPSGQDGHESALTVLGWDGDTFGQIHAEQDANLLILR